MLKLLRFKTGHTVKRSFHVLSPSSCSAKDGDRKPPEIPPSPRRRPMLSPEDRIRDMMENIGETKEPSNGESKQLIKNLLPEEDDNVRKPPFSRRISRRRSLSPMARIQVMMDDQEEKSDKDSKSDK